MKEFIEAAIKENEAQIKKAAADALRERIVSQLTWSLGDTITPLVKKFFTDELEADVSQALMESKPVIMEQLRSSIAACAAEIGVKMQETLTKNLTGYRGGDIIKKMFE